MRIELVDFTGARHVIESTSSSTLKDWFAEWLPLMLSNDPALPSWQMTVRPTTRAEVELVGRYREPAGELDAAGLRAIGLWFIGLAGDQQT